MKSSSAGSELENERSPDVFRFNNRKHHTFRMPDLIALVNTLREHANNPLMSVMLHVAHMAGVYYYVGWIYGLLCARACSRTQKCATVYSPIRMYNIYYTSTQMVLVWGSTLCVGKWRVVFAPNKCARARVCTIIVRATSSCVVPPNRPSIFGCCWH